MPLLDSLTQLTGLDTTVVVAGATDELLQKCCDALEAAPGFPVVNVSEDQFQVEAKYRRPPVWSKLVVTLFPEGADSTRINARISLPPTLFTLIFAPQQGILGRFTPGPWPVDPSRGRHRRICLLPHRPRDRHDRGQQPSACYYFTDPN
jgi:hypothetical protein